MDVFPIPCNASISFSLKPDNCSGFLMPLFSRALLAGAGSKEKKPLSGFRCCSQTGQVKQPLLL